LNKTKLRQVRQREGRYLLRSNLNGEDPAKLWEYYIQLTEIEQAFKELKHDLAIRPIYHQRDDRIDAHIFVAFIAYCLQMVDVHLPTTDGRILILPRYTEPEKDQKLLLQRLQLELPAQPPPRISHAGPQRQSA